MNKVYGSIQILGYSKDNKFASFNLYIHKPIKGVVAIGVYNFEREVTIIKESKIQKEYTKYAEDIIKKILSTNDWDINVRRIRKKRSWIPLSTFKDLRHACKY